MTELHVHLDGSLRKETAIALAKEKGTKITSLTVDEDCDSLETYLECFRLPLSLLQEAPVIERAVRELAEDLLADGVNRAEIRFAPYSFCAKDLSPKEAVDAARRGARAAMAAHKGLKIALILCCMRGQEEAPFVGRVREELTGEKANFRLIDLIEEEMDDVVKAADLAGAEALFPTGRYIELFRYAKRKGVPFTIHAGEGAGAKSVWAALETGTGRIGHGVRAIEEALLVDELVRKKITLECCVISNFHTRCFANPIDHPIKRLFDAGVRVTLNTDNRTISDTTMHREIETVQRLFHFTDEEIRRMQAYAEEACF
ncbi:MAG: adenosine deaminase [Lachnospiraceae bacterium]|nr:adenosine deaminase [Lachnospiraceae bacterium]